jgi:hypothetical protein
LGLAALPVLNVTDELLGAAQFVAWALLKKTATKVITDKFPSKMFLYTQGKCQRQTLIKVLTPS